MVGISRMIRTYNFFSPILLFFFLTLSEKLFVSTDVDNVGGAFSSGFRHFALVGITLFITIILALLKFRDVAKIPTFFTLYILLGLYALASSIWSSAPLKSAGLATIFLCNLIWGARLGRAIQRLPNERRMEAFLSLWATLILIDFVLEVAYKGFPANLDEFSMMAFIVALIAFMHRQMAMAAVFIFIALTGQSFSAVLGSMILLVFYTIFRKPIIGILFVIITVVTGQILWSGILDETLNVYGKDINLLMTGSGRFQAWSSVYEAFIGSDWIRFMFGHGYSTDRDAMLSQNLTWTVDVHNNLLQISYGLGIFGVTLMLGSFAKAFTIQMLPEFRRLRFPIFTALFFFGISSSMFFGRPSISAVFWLSFLASGCAARDDRKNP